MLNIQLLSPEILLSLFALLLLVADIWVPARHGKVLYHMGLFSAVLTLALLSLSYSDPVRLQGSGTLWIVDPMALFFKVLVLVSAILVMLLSLDYVPQTRWGHLGSFASLILLCTVAMMLLVSCSDMLLLYLSLELLSLSSFILAGFERRNLKSSEGAIKYFLIGAFSSALMLYGISLYYGASGTTSLLQTPASGGPMLIMGSLLILAGFAFKASLAPFHLWVPDAYEGAPTPVTAFLSVAPKIAALAAALRVFSLFIPMTASMQGLFAVLAVLTMTVGNLTALWQTNVKRLLAYSSIAQAGYMLIAFVPGGAPARESLLMYSMAYIFMNIGAFAVTILIGNERGYELEDFNGLATRSFGTALTMTFFLLSLAGIPPLAGFIAKFYVFAAAVQSGWYGLAVIGVLNSVISAYYYLRIAYHMFFQPARANEPLSGGGIFLYAGLGLTAAAVLIIGLYPEPFIAGVRFSAETAPLLRDAISNR